MTVFHILWCETWVCVGRRAEHELAVLHNRVVRMTVGTETQDVDACPDELRRFAVLLFCAVQPLRKIARLMLSTPSYFLRVDSSVWL